MRHLLFAITFTIQAAIAQGAPTVTLTAAPTSGAGSVTPSLTWSSTGATACTASGGWSGTKATSGTQVQPAITADVTYTLTCSGGLGAATVAYTAPTTNTNGTPLTNLTGFRVYMGLGSAPLTLGVQVPASALFTTFNNLTPGTYNFAVTAYTSSAESARTATVSKTVSGGSASQSVTVSVNTVPNPPGNVTVTETTAYLALPGDSRWALVPVGTVPLGTVCDKAQNVNGLYVVPRSSVSLSYPVDLGILVAKCA